MDVLLDNRKTILNFVLFQLGWFSCVYSISYQMEWLAVLCLGIVMLIHFVLVKDRLNEAQIVFIAGVTGFIVDTAMVSNHIFIATSMYMADSLAPVWLIGLWMLFGMTLNHSLRWLQGRYLISAVLGSIFAPVAYYAGHRIGALQFPVNEALLGNLLIIGLCWFVVTPLLIALARGYNYNRLEENRI